jgi:hypothetical protein
MSNPPLPPAPEADLAPEQPPERVVRHIHSSEPQGLPLASLDLKVHEAKTARTLTFVVVSMLGLSILLQYVLMGILTVYNKTEAIPTFEHLFNAVLPVLAGLTGSAVTYYLTKEKR